MSLNYHLPVGPTVYPPLIDVLLQSESVLGFCSLNLFQVFPPNELMKVLFLPSPSGNTSLIWSLLYADYGILVQLDILL